MELDGTAPGRYSRLGAGGAGPGRNPPPTTFAAGVLVGRGEQFGPGGQSASNLKVSPITPAVPTPPSEMPGCWIDEAVAPVGATKLLHPAPTHANPAAFQGSLLGTIHGFTQRGWTGMMVPVGPLFPTFSEFEGLNTSAVAVALTVCDGALHMRAKKDGKPARCTCTVTIGFTPKTAPRVEQSGSVPADVAYLTVTVDARLPTAFCRPTACAA